MKISILTTLMILTLGLGSCNYVTETASPTKYLEVTGDFNENFWGDKIKIRGIISNSAKSATFKDAVLKISYLTKTKTVIHEESYTIYDYFPPQSEKHFELKIDNYKNTAGLSLLVVDAKSN